MRGKEPEYLSESADGVLQLLLLPRGDADELREIFPVIPAQLLGGIDLHILTRVKTPQNSSPRLCSKRRCE